MRLLAYLNDKWDKDLDKKMKELQSVDRAAAKKLLLVGRDAQVERERTPRLRRLRREGREGVLPPGRGRAVAPREPGRARGPPKLGGPVLAAAATAAGFPQLAPLALQLRLHAGRRRGGRRHARSGPRRGAAMEPPSCPPPRWTATTAAATTSAATTSAATSASAGSTSATPAALLRPQGPGSKLMEIQRIMDQQKEMFSLVSNCLRTGHDTRMAVIQNVR